MNTLLRTEPWLVDSAVELARPATSPAAATPVIPGFYSDPPSAVWAGTTSWQRPASNTFPERRSFTAGTLSRGSRSGTSSPGGASSLQASSAAGPWSDPVQIPGTLGIDPDIAWDVDGNCYLTWVGFGPGENESGIVQVRLDPLAGQLLEPPSATAAPLPRYRM